MRIRRTTCWVMLASTVATSGLARACTSIIVSRGASRDGSVLAVGLNHHQTLLKSNGPDWHQEPVPLTARDVGGQVAFAEDGNLLVTAHRNGALGVWRYAPAKSADFRR